MKSQICHYPFKKIVDMLNPKWFIVFGNSQHLGIDY